MVDVAAIGLHWQLQEPEKGLHIRPDLCLGLFHSQNGGPHPWSLEIDHNHRTPARMKEA